MSETLIKNLLVERGHALLRAPKVLHPFTNVAESDSLLNDLDGYPHAFVLACIMTRQVKAEKAWLVPFGFQQRLGDFSMKTLLSLPFKRVLEVMAKPEPLHRFIDSMSKFFFAAVHRIGKEYSGVASRIWTGEPSSSTVVYRFLEFDGIGPKIATMAANILARNFKVPFSDYFSIDISADVHVRRVFARLGLSPPDASVDLLIYRARSLHPEFPGLMDNPAWEIGRNWCRPQITNCTACYMSRLCPSAGQTANQRQDATRQTARLSRSAAPKWQGV